MYYTVKGINIYLLGAKFELIQNVRLIGLTTTKKKLILMNYFNVLTGVPYSEAR